MALKVGFGGDDHTKHTVRSQPVDHDGEQVVLEIVGHRDGVEGPLAADRFEVGLDGGNHELIGAASLTGLRQPDVAHIDDGDGEAELGEVPRIIGSAATSSKVPIPQPGRTSSTSDEPWVALACVGPLGVPAVAIADRHVQAVLSSAAGSGSSSTATASSSAWPWSLTA